MKVRLYAIFLLVIMVFNTLKYQLPVVEYTLFKNYITKNLCVFRGEQNNHCHGKCHLNKQLKMLEGTSGDSQSNYSGNNRKPPIKEDKEFFRSHVLTPEPVETSLFLQVNIEAARLQGYASAIYVPPKS